MAAHLGDRKSGRGYTPKATPITMVPIISMLMFGNLMRECGVVDRLARAAQNELANLVTILLSIAIGSTMTVESFLNLSTVMIIVIALLAFALDTAAGLLLAKLMCLLSGGKVNPLIGGCGMSGFPMSARVVQKVDHDEDFSNVILMHAMGSDTAGQIGSVVAGGTIMALLKGQSPRGYSTFSPLRVEGEG